MQEENLRKGAWLEEEDAQLMAYVERFGERRWDSLAKASAFLSGLRRSGKSCRLRWMNYLRPNLKRGRLSAEEERIIIQLQKQWGNKWSKIARNLPGRTDNGIKNYWRSHLRKKIQVEERGVARVSNLPSSTNSEIPGCEATIVPTPSSNRESESDKEASSGTSVSSSDNPFDMFELSRSPYEVRILDWLSGWSGEESEERCYCGCSSPTWDFDFCNQNVWETSGSVSLWERD
ncbi:hypothetical protein NMG60_11001349 [Bertholletia excelsa]